MKNQGISNGLILGLVSVVVSLLIYLISVDLYLNWWVQIFISLVFTIFFMARAGVMARKDGGGYLSFKEALKPVFTTYVIGSLIATIFIYLLYHYIDPGLVDLMKEKAIQATEKMMTMFGAPQEDIDKALDDMEDRSFETGLGKTFLQYLGGLIFGFILTLIIAAIVKKNRPEIAV